MDEDDESSKSVEERKSPSPVEPYNPESPQVGLSFEKKLPSRLDDSSSRLDDSPSLSFPPGLGDISPFILPPLPNLFDGQNNFLGSNLFPFIPPPPPLIFCNNSNNNNFTERFPSKHNGGVRQDHLLYLTGGNSPRHNNHRPPHRNNNNNHKRRGPYNGDRPYNRPLNHNNVSSELYIPKAFYSFSLLQPGKNDGASYNLEAPTSKLILVRNVPLEMNKMDLLDNHFSKFGKINSIEVWQYFFLQSLLI